MPRGIYKRTKPVWNKGLTKDTDERIAKADLKRQNTSIKKYGVNNVLQSKEVLDKISDDRHSGKLAQKAQETKLSRYGNKNYNNMSKNKETKLSRYGDENYNNPEKNAETRINNSGSYWSDEQRQKISESRIDNNSQQKAMQTIIAKYGNTDEYYKLVSSKRYETMKKNGTLGSKETKPEKELYNDLCNTYGEENIIKQYYDKERYPFRCDFYIIPEDKFIELNGFWTHGPHPFNKDDVNDQLLLANLEEDAEAGDKWAKAFIYTWTDLDVRKLETAKRNNLNFEFIYWYNK